MEKNNQNKIKLLKIWEMLCADSDENNPLTTNEILARLKDQGIGCDRRTLYADIRTLNDYGYEVMSDLRNHANCYYVSERGFDVPELKILMDAVTASTFISAKKTKELHNKIAFLAGSYKAELLKKSQDADNLIKSENEGVYYVVNELDEAILEGKMVSFTYFDYAFNGEKVSRQNGERYIISPVATVFSGDRYYLVAVSQKRDGLTHYRIDKMQDVRIEAENAVVDLEKTNLAEHKKQLFSMYGGDTVRVGFEADGSLIDVIFDKFGTKTHLTDIGDNKFTFATDIQVSPVFFGWCFTFGERLKVISPNSLVRQIKDYLASLNNNYN